MSEKEADEHIDEGEEADQELKIDDIEETANEMQQMFTMPSNEPSNVKPNELIDVEDEGHISNENPSMILNESTSTP